MSRSSTCGAARDRRAARAARLAEPRLCFAFGSNMNAEQMARRVPGAFEVAVATLRDFDLDFVGWSSGWGGGVATVAPRRGRNVAGVLYALTDEQLAALDRFEGVPTVYRRETCSVIVRGSGVAVRAELYRHRDATRAAPSGRYLATIRRALRDRRIAHAHVDAAALRAAAEERVPRGVLLTHRGWPLDLIAPGCVGAA